METPVTLKASEIIQKLIEVGRHTPTNVTAIKSTDGVISFETVPNIIAMQQVTQTAPAQPKPAEPAKEEAKPAADEKAAEPSTEAKTFGAAVK